MKKSENRKEMFNKYYKLSSLFYKVADKCENAIKFGKWKNHDEYEYYCKRGKYYYTLSEFSIWYAYKFYSDFKKGTWRQWKYFNDIPRNITLNDMLNKINKFVK